MRSLNSNEVCLQSRQETQAAVDYRKRVKAFKPGCSFIEQPIPDQEADLGCAWVTGLERSWMNIMTFYVKGCAVRSKFKMLRTSQSWSEVNMWSSEAFIFYFADVPMTHLVGLMMPLNCHHPYLSSRRGWGWWVDTRSGGTIAASVCRATWTQHWQRQVMDRKQLLYRSQISKCKSKGCWPMGDRTCY